MEKNTAFISSKAPVLILILGLQFTLFSCNRSSREVFTPVPFNSIAVGTFHPGNLHKKASLQDLNFVKQAAEKNPFNRLLIDNPALSGIRMNTYAAVFITGDEEKYLGVSMSLNSQKVFEEFLHQISGESHEDLQIVRDESISYILQDDNILAWNKKVLVNLRPFGCSLNPVPLEKVRELFSLSDEDCILSDRDFRIFRKNQKDMNLWMSSNQLGSVSNMDFGGLNFLGTLNNNYFHVFAEFLDGKIEVNSWFRPNPDLQKSIQDYNFLDGKAGKELLAFIPAENLVVAGNLKLNPEKMLALLELIGKADSLGIGNVITQTGKNPGELLRSLTGDLAFSIHGFGRGSENDSIPEDETITIPKLVAMMKLNRDQKINELFPNASTLEGKNDIFMIKTGRFYLYLGIVDDILLLTNQKGIADAIFSSTPLGESALSLDLGDKLSGYPLCFYINPDPDAYGSMMKGPVNILPEQMGLPGMDKTGKEIRSVILQAGTEKSSLVIEMKDPDTNALQAILKSLDQ